MKTAALSFVAVLALTSSATALAQQAPPAAPPPPGAQPTPDEAVPPPVRPTSPPSGVQVAPPAYPQQPQGYSTQQPDYAPQPPPPMTMGSWMYTREYGWIWVPSDASTVLYSDVPYTYLYTPTYGWTWYVSPWGPGRVYSGDWLRHAWHPRVSRPWVAPPAVSIRLEPWRHVAQPHVYEERRDYRGHYQGRDQRR